MDTQEFFGSGLEAIRAYEEETGADHGVLYRSMSETTTAGEYAALYPLGEDGEREMLTPTGRIPARSGYSIHWDHREDALEETGRIEKMLDAAMMAEYAEREGNRLPWINVFYPRDAAAQYILVNWPAPPEGVEMLKGRSEARLPLLTNRGPKGGREAEDYLYVADLRSLARILDRPEYRSIIALLRALAACPDRERVDALLADRRTPVLIQHLAYPRNLGKFLAAHGWLDEERKHAEG